MFVRGWMFSESLCWLASNFVLCRKVFVARHKMMTAATKGCLIGKIVCTKAKERNREANHIRDFSKGLTTMGQDKRYPSEDHVIGWNLKISNFSHLLKKKPPRHFFPSTYSFLGLSVLFIRQWNTCYLGKKG